MIPKILHFIYIGKNKPKYVDFAVKSFQKINPNFEIRYTYEPNIDNANNPQIRQICDLYDNKIFNKNIDMSNIDTDIIKIFNEEFSSKSWSYKALFLRQNKLISVNHVYRVFSIYKYGGIYLDNDMFPIKPFDNDILKNAFMTYNDNCWFGGDIGDIIINNEES